MLSLLTSHSLLPAIHSPSLTRYTCYGLSHSATNCQIFTVVHSQGIPIRSSPFARYAVHQSQITICTIHYSAPVVPAPPPLPPLLPLPPLAPLPPRPRLPVPPLLPVPLLLAATALPPLAALLLPLLPPLIAGILGANACTTSSAIMPLSASSGISSICGTFQQDQFCVLQAYY